MLYVVLGVALAAALVWYARFPARPGTLGVRDGRLAPCPRSQNCVSSSESGAKRVEALHFDGEPRAALARAVACIESMRGATVVTRDHRYVHAEFRTPLVGFVDDLELLLDAEESKIELRSASRRGYSDLGVNRERVESLRESFHASSDRA